MTDRIRIDPDTLGPAPDGTVTSQVVGCLDGPGAPQDWPVYVSQEVFVAMKRSRDRYREAWKAARTAAEAR